MEATPAYVDVRYKTIAGTIVGVVLANLAVIFRFVARRVGHISLKLDDLLIVIGLVFHWGVAVGGLIMLDNGLGRPMSVTPPDRLTVYFKVQYSGSFSYTLCVAFTKISILYTYWRVFDCKEVRRLVFFVGILVLAWTIATCVAGALACTPVEKMWDPTVPGACINIAKFYYGIQIPNILTDIFIILIPIHEITKLRLPWGQKLSVMGIFGVAALTAVFDIIRLVAMIQLVRSKEDPTVAVADATVWTCVEPAVGIMAACLSNMRPLYNYVANKNGQWQERRKSRARFGSSARPLGENTNTVNSDSTGTSSRLDENAPRPEATILDEKRQRVQPAYSFRYIDIEDGR